MILVTGATGTVGRELLTLLRTRQIPCRVLVHKQTDIDILRDDIVEPVLGDLSQVESVRRALQGIDHVYLLAPAVPQLAEYEELLIAEAQKAGVQHIVKHSIFGAESTASCIFLRLHAQSEAKLLQSNIPYTILRPNSFMQRLVPSFANSIINEGTLYVPLGDAAVSLLDARDLAEIATQVLTQPGHLQQSYDITGPEAVSGAEMAEKFSVLLDKKVTYTHVADEVARASFVGTGTSTWNADALLSLFQFYRSGGAAPVTDTYEKITHKKPRTVDAFLKEHVSAFRGDSPDI